MEFWQFATIPFKAFNSVTCLRKRFHDFKGLFQFLCEVKFNGGGNPFTRKVSTLK